ncbi:MAG: alpha/beta hydrolase [Hyphomicrobiales bacterium]
MKTHLVKSPDGTVLAVDEAGDPAGPPILFIHGYSQSRLCWHRQMTGTLAARHRLVAMDMRGHGLSARPHDAYGDSRVWADDVAAVIETLGLDRPVISGWSYGGALLCDYVRFHGTGAIAGLQFVAAVSRLGKISVPFLGAEFAAMMKGFFATETEASIATLENLVALMPATPLEPLEAAALLGEAAIVPPHVRRALFSRTVDNDDLLPTIDIPVLLTQGDADRIILPTMSEHQAGLLNNATRSLYPGVGHAPFLEATTRFDRELADFVARARAS